MMSSALGTLPKDPDETMALSHKSFNKNADPFYPEELAFVHRIRCTNLIHSEGQGELEKLIENLIKTKVPSESGSKFRVADIVKNSPDDGFAIVETTNYEFAFKLTEMLDGFEWNGKIVDAKLVRNTTLYQNNYYYPPYPTKQTSYEYSNVSPGAGPQLSINDSSPVSGRPTFSRKHSSVSSKSRRNSTGYATKPVPPFLMNLVSLSGSTTSGSNTPQSDKESFISQNELPESKEYLEVENDEGQTIKVNPCRLFIGNVPFNSTWASLKNFLVAKAKSLEPDNEIQILRVEIPIQTNTSVSGLDISNGLFNNEVPRSRGFAIVTTGSKECSEKIIKYFDNIEFEGRALTVRYDKFPDFNNYVLQQLYSHHNAKHPKDFRTANTNANVNFNSNLLNNLALERHFLQSNYYGRSPINTFYPYAYYYNPNTNPVFQQYFNAPYLMVPHSTTDFISPKRPNGAQYQIPPAASGVSKKSFDAIKDTKSVAEADSHESGVEDDKMAKELVESFISLGLTST